MHQSGLLTLFIKTMWGLKMERFSTPKVLAVGPNLREWWVGEKKLAAITMYCGECVAVEWNRQQSKEE